MNTEAQTRRWLERYRKHYPDTNLVKAVGGFAYTENGRYCMSACDLMWSVRFAEKREKADAERNIGAYI